MSLTLGDPEKWHWYVRHDKAHGKPNWELIREPFTELDLQYLSAMCGEYEFKRKQMILASKLVGVEDEVVRSHNR